MLFKLFGIVVTMIVGTIIGLSLSKDIDNSVLYTLFWILYVITYLTFANVIAVSLFYDNLRTKTGPPGPRGTVGEAGEVGEEGVCSKGCQQMECAEELQNIFIAKINELAGNPHPPIKFLNSFMINKLKKICTSKQFQKTSEIKGAESVINYITNIIEEWAKLLYEAGGKEYIENVGAEDDYNWKNNKKPFDEITKYDIYYWNMNKLFKPIGVDVCDDPSINKNLPQKEKPQLFLVHTNIYDKISSGDGYRVYRAKHMKNSKINLDMYPMGDVAVKSNDDVKSNNKSVDGITAPDGIGPQKMTSLIAGNVKPPAYFERKGQFWQAKPPAGYICLGDTVTNDVNQYRCVPEECVDELSTDSNQTYNGAHIYSSSKGSMWGMHGGDMGTNGNETSNKNYNLFRTTSGNEGHHEKFYKIKDICLNSALPPNKKNDNGDWVSNQWHGYPEKNPGYAHKYSIFNYLGIIPEGVILNYETKNKYYFVISGNEPNVYFIKYYDSARGKRGNFQIAGNNDVNVNLTTNNRVIKQLWSLEYNDPNHVRIRSKSNGKYLGLHYKDGYELVAKQYNKNELDNKRTQWRIISTSTGEREMKK